MRAYKIELPPELASFIDDAVAAGDWVSADALVESAIAKLRTECMLGGPSRTSATPTLPEFTAPVAAQMPVVDTMRESFDSPKFMAELMGKLRVKK